MTSAYQTATPFLVGSALSRTWEIMTQAFGKFFALALIPMAPVILLTVLVGPSSGQTSGQPSGAAMGGLASITILLTVVLQLIAQATIIYGTFQELKGQEFSIGESLSVGFRRFMPVLGVGLLGWLLIGLASILLLVPGLILFCMWYVMVPVCVIEKPGVWPSLGRSSELTKGCRWQIFGLLILVIIATFLITFVFEFVAALTGSVIIILAVKGLSQVFIVAYGAILAAVVYRDLRMAKEGVDTSKIANIFT